MRKKKLNDRGFTLIEVIVSLVLVGIIAAVAGMGIVQITKQYLFAQKTGETAQVAQIAMARIVKELKMVRTCSSTPSATSINFVTPTRTGSISRVGNTIEVNDETLIENVTGFSLKYYNTYSGANTSYSAAGTTMIGIDFNVAGADGTTSTFSGRALIRN